MFLKKELNIKKCLTRFYPYIVIQAEERSNTMGLLNVC